MISRSSLWHFAFALIFLPTISILFITCGGRGGLGGGLSDTSSPTVLSVTPSNGATGVAVNTSISVTFSEPMSAATITTTNFTVKTGSTAVPGTVGYTGATARLTPTGNWAYSTSYIVTITTGVKDLAGNALENSYGFGFTTSSSGNPPGAVPTVTVRPVETSDNLYNPGMGFADFHFGWGNPPLRASILPRPSPTSAGRGTNSSPPRGSITLVWWIA
jgi:hypothetical protein